MHDHQKQGFAYNPYAQNSAFNQQPEQHIHASHYAAYPQQGYYNCPPQMMPQYYQPAPAPAWPHQAHHMMHHSMPMQHPMGIHPMHYQAGMQPPHWQMPTQHQVQSTDDCDAQNNELLKHAQTMLEGVMGEEAGVFKEMLAKFGINDKEFWKGAMVGAAAVMLMNNETVRNKLMGLVSGAGELLKTGSHAVKENAAQAMHSAMNHSAMNSEIFHETHAEGSEDFAAHPEQDAFSPQR